MDTLASFPSKSLEMLFVQIFVLLCAICLKWYDARRNIKQPSALGFTLVFLSTILVVVLIHDLVIYISNYPVLLLETLFVLPSVLNVVAFFIIIAITGVWKFKKLEK